jgi:hypothetical protein
MKALAVPIARSVVETAGNEHYLGATPLCACAMKRIVE